MPSFSIPSRNTRWSRIALYGRFPFASFPNRAVLYHVTTCRQIRVFQSQQPRPSISSQLTTASLDHILNAFMTDLTTVLPSFSTQPYVRLLRSLESNNVTTADLISQDHAEIAKRAQLPLAEIQKLSADILNALQTSLGIKDDFNTSEGDTSLRKSGIDVLKPLDYISTLDDHLDRALGGGVPVGYVTEVTGER